MKRDKLISFRVPSEVYDQIVTVAKERDQSVSAFIKDSLTASTWRIELRRNRVYHREMLKQLKKIEDAMRETETARRKAGENKPKRAKQVE